MSMPPETDAYIRQVRRHLGVLPRRARPLVLHELASHIAGQALTTVQERLGEPRTVARALVAGWLEAREAARSPRELLGQAWRGGMWAAGVTAVVVLGLSALNNAVIWKDLMRDQPSALGLLAQVELLNLPAILEVWAPPIAFCFALGAMIRLGRECSTGTFLRLAPRVAKAVAVGSVLASLAIFGWQEAVVTNANRALVDLVRARILAPAPPQEVRRSPQELTMAQVWARQGQGTAEERAADARALRWKLWLPTLVVPMAMFGVALGALATRLRWPRGAAWLLGLVGCAMVGTAEATVVGLLAEGPWMPSWPLLPLAGAGAIAAVLQPRLPLEGMKEP